MTKVSLRLQAFPTQILLIVKKPLCYEHRASHKYMLDPENGLPLVTIILHNLSCL